MMRRMMLVVGCGLTLFALAAAQEQVKVSPVFQTSADALRLELTSPKREAVAWNRVLGGTRLTNASQTNDSGEARSSTLWLGYGSGSSLGVFPFSYESHRGKTAYEVSGGFVTAGGPAGGGSVVSIGVAMNLYSQLDTPGTPRSGGMYYSFNVGGMFATGGGENASLLSAGASVGYRYNFTDRFSGRVSLGAAYFFFGSGEGWSVSGLVFPTFGGGIGIMF